MNNDNSETILLVEDEAIIAMMEKTELEKYGYIVHHVTTGEKAVQTIIGNTHPIDLILMDIDLGSGIDGTQAAEKILKEKDIPIVFLSSHTEPEIVEKTEKITSYGYVVKNSGIVVLDASIKMALKLFNACRKTIEKEEELRILADASFEAIFFSENGIALNQNKTAEKMFGYSFDEVYGKPATNWIHPDYWDIVKENIVNNITTPYEVIAVTKDGREFPCEIQAEIVTHDNRQLRITALRDITERKQAEKKLYFKENIIESADSAISACDLEGKMSYANQNFYTVWGFENQSEFIGRHFKEFWMVEDRIDEITSALLNEGTWSDDIKALRKDGTLFDVHVKASAIFDSERNRIGFMSTTTDITERKRADDALKYKSERMNFILKATRTNINILDSEYNLREVDVSWQNIYGDPMGKKCYEYFMGFDKPCPDCGVPRAMATRKTVIYDEFLPKENKYIEVHTIPFHDENGEWLAVEFNIDITERKQAEVEIKRQLSEKETLLKEVHHRIKNNINSIEGLLSIQAESTDSSKVKTALQESISRIQSTRVLYEKLLISKVYQDVSIKNYIDSLIDSLVAVFPENKNISIEKNIMDFTVNSKKAIPIGIIINELMTNIFKYAFKKMGKGHIFIEVNKIENNVTLTIKDNGIGIDARVDSNKSPGFGLTVVKMLAEQLEGTFTMKNDNGTRSVLKFEI